MTSSMTAVYRHQRHPWCQPGDRPDRVWMLRFDDPSMREMIWLNEGAEQEARAAWDRYAPTWNCTLLSAAPQQADATTVVEAGELARRLRRGATTLRALGNEHSASEEAMLCEIAADCERTADAIAKDRP